jgi:hypothetical protein
MPRGTLAMDERFLAIFIPLPAPLLWADMGSSIAFEQASSSFWCDGAPQWCAAPATL